MSNTLTLQSEPDPPILGVRSLQGSLNPSSDYPAIFICYGKRGREKPSDWDDGWPRILVDQMEVMEFCHFRDFNV